MAIPSYIKNIFINDQAPALNDVNMNKIENGIFDVTEEAILLDSRMTSTETRVTDLETIVANNFFTSHSLNSTDNPELADIGNVWVQGAEAAGDAPAGTYLLTFSFTYNLTTTSTAAMWQISINGGTWEIYSRESKDVDDFDTKSYSFPYTHTGGTLTFSTQFQKSDLLGTYTVQYSNAIIDRKS